MAATNDIHARVAKALVQALGVKEEDIKPFATLQGDLGAESIDFLDIIFRLEREFTIKIEQDELFPEPVLRSGTDLVHNGRLTDEGLSALRARLPYADLRNLDRDRRLNRIDDLFTVDLLSRFIAWKLGESDVAKHGAEEPVLVAPTLILH